MSAVTPSSQTSPEGVASLTKTSDDYVNIGGAVNSSSNHQSPTDLRRGLCSQNIFIFHLPSDWKEEDLKKEFSLFGEISSARVVKRPNGTSKGYGFVCFKQISAARDAVESYDGRAVGGKRLNVSLKKTPEECLKDQIAKLTELSNNNQPFDQDRDCTLFIFHIPPIWEDAELYRHFESFGSLTSAKVAKKEDSASKGYGFVTFDNPRSAALAIANMNGVQVGSSKRLKVQLKQQPSPVQAASSCTIFVFHVPNEWTANNLRQHFSHYGKILGSTIQRDVHGNSRGLKVSLKRGEEGRFFDYRNGLGPMQQFTPLPGAAGLTPGFFGPEFSYYDPAAAAAVAAAEFSNVSQQSGQSFQYNVGHRGIQGNTAAVLTPYNSFHSVGNYSPNSNRSVRMTTMPTNAGLGHMIHPFGANQPGAQVQRCLSWGYNGWTGGGNHPRPGTYNYLESTC